MKNNDTRKSSKRLALRREMTFGEIFRRFPQARMLMERGLQDIDPARDAGLTIEEYARRFKYGCGFDTSMTSFNNCLVLLENADRQIDGDPALVDYDLFHETSDLPSPESTRPAVNVKMDAERLGLDCDGGLPYLRWVLSDGLNAVQLQQDGPPIEMLTCFQRVAGMCCERIFDGGFLDLLADGRRHRFDRVHLHSFGYENCSQANAGEKSALLMCGDRLWFNLACPGKTVQWILDESKMSMISWAIRQVFRRGWDSEARCLFFTTVDDRPNRVGELPKAYEGFTEKQIRDFSCLELSEMFQGARPMHTECWLAVGPGDRTEYSGQNGSLHTFSAGDGGCLMIGIGSTRQGALAELRAARERQDLPRRRQKRRYELVRQRLPRLEAPGRETLSEIAALAPLFLESLKTGFVLMRSRPHTGAICGGWDQLMIAAPMVRSGDYEMTPRYLEHWLHQVALDGQIFHVSDVDLSPATLYRRWDLDDFMYLIVAAQWIAHRGDTEMLSRLAAKCTHMLRVMLDDSDQRTALIAGRGEYPDWPSLEVGRTGLTYPVLENGLWYEALRWWEGLTARLGETVLSGRIRAAAETVRGCFAGLYLDQETGMVWDAVHVETYQPVRSLVVWGLSPFHGCFGHELFSDEQIERIAKYIAEAHLDMKFPCVRAMVGVEVPSVYEKLHWPLFDHMVAKVLRRGRNPRGLEDFLQIIERQHRWMHTATEVLNIYYDLNHDFLSQNAFWFGWSAGARYEALLSGFAGIWEEPGALAYVPADMDQTVELTNLPYRGGVWDIRIQERGAWVRRFIVDGVEITGISKIPEPWLKPGRHTLVIERTATPPATPFILDSVGLRLLETRWERDELHACFAGPGRAVVRFYSKHRPAVWDAGTEVAVDWDAAAGIGRAEINRGPAEAEFIIKIRP